MGQFYLVADADGCHQPTHRDGASIDLADAARTGETINWSRSMSSADHTDLVQQWMSMSPALGPLSDEWIPAEWLLRLWASPAMAGIETQVPGQRARLFAVDAEPVLLARSIPVAIPELALIGADSCRTAHEVPRWWLLGPCGREVLAFLRGLNTFADSRPFIAGSRQRTADVMAHRRMALDVIDSTFRGGAYHLAMNALSSFAGALDDSGREMAADAALGFILKDVWPDARTLYTPWIDSQGVPDLSLVEDDGDRPYPEWRVA